MKSVHLLTLTVLAAAALNGQQYYSNPAPDCSALGENPVAVTNSSGTTIGYSCYASGTFVWYAAGGGQWSSQIRVAAPSTGAINVDYTFYDTSGNPFNLDTRNSAAATVTNNEVNFSLNPNQPQETDLLGGAGNGPGYSTLEVGSVYVYFLCPNSDSCLTVTPQLLYSALPSTPWSLSVPIVWDGNAWPEWSAEGIDNRGTGNDAMSFVIYNDDVTATTCTVTAYDSNGNQAATATTKTINPLQNSGNGEGATYGANLTGPNSLFGTTKLPSGLFKLLFDCGSVNTEVEVLQYTGASATTLQVAYDGSSNGGASSSAMARHMNPWTASRVQEIVARHPVGGVK